MSTSIAPSPRLLVIGESSSARVGADEVGRKAKGRGLTPEMLDSLLKGA